MYAMSVMEGGQISSYFVETNSAVMPTSCSSFWGTSTSWRGGGGGREEGGEKEGEIENGDYRDLESKLMAVLGLFFAHL